MAFRGSFRGGPPGGSTTKSFDGKMSVMTQVRKEREAESNKMHSKTFQAWMNVHLRKRDIHINDLAADCSDATALINLLEIISGTPCPQKYTASPKNDPQKLANATVFTAFLAQFINISVNPPDIVAGNMKVLLSIVWRMILLFQVQHSKQIDPSQAEAAKQQPATRANREAKQRLVQWISEKTNLNITDCDNCFFDGFVFCKLVQAYNPSIIQDSEIRANDPIHNLNLAFTRARDFLGIQPILDPVDLINPNPELRPDEQCLMTYLFEFPKTFLAKPANQYQLPVSSDAMNQPQPSINPLLTMPLNLPSLQNSNPNLPGFPTSSATQTAGGGGGGGGAGAGAPRYSFNPLNTNPAGGNSAGSNPLESAPLPLPGRGVSPQPGGPEFPSIPGSGGPATYQPGLGSGGLDFPSIPGSGGAAVGGLNFPSIPGSGSASGAGFSFPSIPSGGNNSEFPSVPGAGGTVNGGFDFPSIPGMGSGGTSDFPSGYPGVGGGGSSGDFFPSIPGGSAGMSHGDFYSGGAPPPRPPPPKSTFHPVGGSFDSGIPGAGFPPSGLGPGATGQPPAEGSTDWNTKEVELKQQLQQQVLEQQKLLAELERLRNQQANPVGPSSPSIIEENLKLQDQISRLKERLVGHLRVTVIEARGLRGGSSIDPYVVLILDRFKEKTSKVKKSNNPVWNQEFNLGFVLNMTVFDHKKVGSHEFLGKIDVPVQDLEDGRKVLRWFTLQPKKAGGKVAGEIKVEIEYKFED